MATSSGSINSAVDHDDHKIMMVNNSGSGSDQEDVQHVDQRKRKRMMSNRESARRSRMRKQKHLDDLVLQVGELTKDNGQILTSINITAQIYTRLEAENSILRAQMAELTNRLQSLNDIINCINSSNNCLFESNNNATIIDHHNDNLGGDDDYFNNEMMINNMMMNNPWNSIPMNQPIMASADQMYMY